MTLDDTVATVDLVVGTDWNKSGNSAAVLKINDMLDSRRIIDNREKGANFATTMGTGKAMGILRAAFKGKENFNLGSASRSDANKLGIIFVGEGYRISSNGLALISADGMRPVSYTHLTLPTTPYV